MHAFGHPSLVFRAAAAALPATLAAALALGATGARADAVSDWNHTLGELIANAKLGTPPAIRISALVQTAVHDALQSPSAGSPDAAVASASRTVMLRVLPPAQHAAVEAAYGAAIGALPDGPARAAGIARGAAAAQALLERRAGDAVAAADTYRPHTTPGQYVPTVTPAVTQWPRRMPWLMSGVAQFRPAAPPALTSETWARDFDETRTLGARASTQRSAEQTDIARFWEYSLPSVYFGVVRSVAGRPGRSIGENARLYAAAAQAMDDAMIAVFDAKYHYNFWRPGTAIRNADLDGHAGTARDAGWLPLIDVPMHPEYPSGHAILAASVATVVAAAGGHGAALSTSSPTLQVAGKPATRRWDNAGSFVREVSDARIWGGLHFRSATDAGEAMGRQIGALAVERVLRGERTAH